MTWFFKRSSKTQDEQLQGIRSHLSCCRTGIVCFLHAHESSGSGCGSLGHERYGGVAILQVVKDGKALVDNNSIRYKGRNKASGVQCQEIWRLEKATAKREGTQGFGEGKQSSWNNGPPQTAFPPPPHAVSRNNVSVTGHRRFWRREMGCSADPWMSGAEIGSRQGISCAAHESKNTLRLSKSTPFSMRTAQTRHAGGLQEVKDANKTPR